MEINLNAIGKGYAVDRCGELLRAAGVEDFLIHGGQSSVLAGGSRAGADADARGWSVALKHPLKPQQRLAEIWLRNRALGMSGSGVQFFHHQGRRYGHVLDPRTGWPAEGVLSATGLLPSAALADAVSTACFVMGREGVEEYCRNHTDVSAILVCPGEYAAAASTFTPADWNPKTGNGWTCLLAPFPVRDFRDPGRRQVGRQTKSCAVPALPTDRKPRIFLPGICAVVRPTLHSGLPYRLPTESLTRYAFWRRRGAIPSSTRGASDMNDTDTLPAEPETRKAFGQPLAGLYDKPIMTAEQHILHEQRRFPARPASSPGCSPASRWPRS